MNELGIFVLGNLHAVVLLFIFRYYSRRSILPPPNRGERRIRLERSEAGTITDGPQLAPKSEPVNRTKERDEAGTITE